MNLKWLASAGHDGLEPAVTAFEQIASVSKTFILKAARAVNSKRAFDSTAIFDEMVHAWDSGMEALTARLCV